VWDVFGQDIALGHLVTAFEKDSLHHAYLFSGPQQIGKKLMAINLAQALNCESENAPCGDCDSCRRIESLIHADVCLIDMQSFDDEPDNRKVIKTEEIKDIQPFIHLPPFEGKMKVIIIDGVEMFSAHAANRLLKNLEEPPLKVTFILLAEVKESVLPTILSRCQHIEFKRTPYDKLASWLCEQEEVELSTAKLVSHLSGGRPGWALSALKQDDFLSSYIEQRDRLLHLFNADRSERFGYAEKMAVKFSSDRFLVMDELKCWKTLARDVLFMKYGLEDKIINCDALDKLHELAERCHPSNISNILGAIEETEYQLHRNVSPRLALESLMLGLECLQRISIKL
jgi:DNA polymerase-3 subunit delta'